MQMLQNTQALVTFELQNEKSRPKQLLDTMKLSNNEIYLETRVDHEISIFF